VKITRFECLDHLLILNARHFERVLWAYAKHYNGHRPHQGIPQAVPNADVVPSSHVTSRWTESAVPSREYERGRMRARMEYPDISGYVLKRQPSLTRA